jgi:hypothetical protein
LRRALRSLASTNSHYYEIGLPAILSANDWPRTRRINDRRDSTLARSAT